MDAESYFIDLIVTYAITLGVILTPYIITALITRKRISFKTANTLTITFSVLSFIVFCVIYFLIGEGMVKISPIVIWNTVGYFIIKPKSGISNSEKIKPNELKTENPESEKLNTAKLTNTVEHNKQNINLDESTIANLILTACKKSNLSILLTNEFSICDSVLFCRYLFIHTLKQNNLDEKVSISELDRLVAKGLNNIYNIQFDKCLSYFKKRSDFYSRIFAKVNDNINIVTEKLETLIEHDIVAHEFVEFDEFSPIMLTDFDKMFSVKTEIIQLSNSILKISKAYVERLKNENKEFKTTNSIASTIHESNKSTIIKDAKKKPKFKTAAIVLSITTAVFMISTVILSTSLITVNSKYEELNAKVYDLESSISSKENEIKNLKESNEDETIENLKNKLTASFYTEYAGCVGENDYYYHSDPYCDYFDSTSFYIYNIESAEAKGYKPCPYCVLNVVDKAKENDRINWEKEKNSDKPDLDVNWN